MIARLIKNYYAKGDSFQSLTLSLFVLQYERMVSFKKITMVFDWSFQDKSSVFFFFYINTTFSRKVSGLTEWFIRYPLEIY